MCEIFEVEFQLNSIFLNKGPGKRCAKSKCWTYERYLVGEIYQHMRQANRYNFKESEKAAQDLNWIDVISSDRAINSEPFSLSSSPIPAII